jgi:hypothetical protein
MKYFTAMKISLRASRLIASILMCSTIASAQSGVDFNKLWADCGSVCKPSAADKFFQYPDYEERLQKAMEMSGILDSLGEMRDHFLRTGDMKDLFPAIYYNTTDIEFKAILNDEMAHPVQKMGMMENFYDAYLMNRAAFDSGGLNAVEPHWRDYYRSAQEANKLLAETGFGDQLMLAGAACKVLNDGVKAHVDFDLPRAIRASVPDSDVGRQKLRADFDKTNPFFDKSITMGRQDINHALFPGSKTVGVSSRLASLICAPDVVGKRNKAWGTAVNRAAPLPTSGAQPQYKHPASTTHLPESLKRGICFSVIDESSYTVGAVFDTGKAVCHDDTVKSEASGSIFFGAWVGRAGPDGFKYPQFAQYNFVDLREYNHGSLVLNVKDKIVGGGSSSERTSDIDGQIRLIVNDNDYSNNDGEYSVNLTLSGYRLYKLPFK